MDTGKLGSFKKEIYTGGERMKKIKERTQNEKISLWKGCCHYCNRGRSIAGKIGNDGLCSFCRENGRIATW